MSLGHFQTFLDLFLVFPPKLKSGVSYLLTPVPFNIVLLYDLHVINCFIASRPFYTWLDSYAFKMILGRAKS